MNKSTISQKYLPDDDGAIQFSLEAYFVFLVVLLVVMVIMFAWLHLRQKAERRDFLKSFDHRQLRMDPQKVGLVYRIISEDADALVVTPIWDSNRIVPHGKEYKVAVDQLVPFNKDRFF